MTKFYNPYHFVPVIAEGRAEDLPLPKFRSRETEHVRHDLYASGGNRFFSGRLICRLTTEDPVVVGNEHKKPDPQGPTWVYSLEADDKPIIPATTLKGLISSIAEAASNSALRVLEDKPLSYRVAANSDPPSAIGMVVEVNKPGEGKEWRLRPLALPTMRIENSRAVLRSDYRKMFPDDGNPPPLKVYVGNRAQISSDSFLGGLPFRSFSAENPDYCYAKLTTRKWGQGHSLALDKTLHLNDKQAFVLAQETRENSPPIPADGLPVTETDRKEYTRGILRILGVPGRMDIPGNKKHELFIPYTKEDEKRETFPMPNDVVERFYRMADERTAAKDEAPFWPYEPRGTQRNLHPKNKDDHNFRLKHGDLVYFKPAPKGDAVGEISLSSIWRRWAGSAYDYFTRISSEKLPFDDNRQSISIAEQIFGFTAKSKREDGKDAPALAGRLRFSSGVLAPGQNGPYYNEDWTLLKILGSPKPPQPAFYFKYTGGKSARIEVGSLISSNQVIPQGRKFYLHRSPQDMMPWKTHHEHEDLKQKSKVRPMKPNLTFFFHIDFDNLSLAELGLLCYAIKPAEEFRHKIGMGKPVGLGKVRIDPLGLFLVNRQSRYNETDLFGATRYHQVWVYPGEQVAGWPDIYHRERSEADITRLKSEEVSFDRCRNNFSSTMNKDIKYALELLGDPTKTRRYSVHTPQLEGKDPEKETYAWFVENQRPMNIQQRLEPITAGKPLPVLEETWEMVRP